MHYEPKFTRGESTGDGDWPWLSKLGAPRRVAGWWVVVVLTLALAPMLVILAIATQR